MPRPARGEKRTEAVLRTREADDLAAVQIAQLLHLLRGRGTRVDLLREIDAGPNLGSLRLRKRRLGLPDERRKFLLARTERLFENVEHGKLVRRIRRAARKLLEKLPRIGEISRSRG